MGLRCQILSTHRNLGLMGAVSTISNSIQPQPSTTCHSGHPAVAVVRMQGGPGKACLIKPSYTVDGMNLPRSWVSAASILPESSHRSQGLPAIMSCIMVSLYPGPSRNLDTGPCSTTFSAKRPVQDSCPSSFFAMLSRIVPGRHPYIVRQSF